MAMTDNNPTRCGYVAIVGRPNVGKSTLLNHILGQKLAITSRKPQTTRHNMLGIKTEGDVQAIYVDTPGMHKANDKALNRYMNRNASAALKDVDVVIFVVDRTKWTDEDQLVLERVQYVTGPLIIAVNKTDRMEEKAELIPHLQWLQEQLPNAEVMPISRSRGTTSTRWKHRSPSTCRRTITSSRKTRSPTAAAASWPPNWCARRSCASWARSCRTRSPWRSRNSSSRAMCCTSMR
jgi:GTP-binding protein Era